MAGNFTQIRPEWRGELEAIGQKLQKIMVGAYYFLFYLRKLFSVEKSCFRLLLYTLEKAREDFF